MLCFTLVGKVEQAAAEPKVALIVEAESGANRAEAH
jgi:hypothetical protein